MNTGEKVPEIIQLRPNQKSILRYERGQMGISAVPGSGKTWTLSLLAAKLISSGFLSGKQEVLVVTLVNSAVEHFSNQVEKFADDFGFLPLNFRVRTLHGLAHDIVRERPSLVGLSNNFIIVDEREANLILTDVSTDWLRANPEGLDDWLSLDENESRNAWIRREKLPEVVQEIALQFIRQAKDLELTPEDVSNRLDDLPIPLPLARLGATLYSDYQRALNYRGAVDFDDLIRLALFSLKISPAYLQRLHRRWPFILEDEAQDSNRLQEEILSLLSGGFPGVDLNNMGGNWVRVGDPNQAIYDTFTTADPVFLQNFLKKPGVQEQNLPTSGRSSLSIIRLANELVRWVQSEHPCAEVRDALTSPPFIEPVSKDDPDPNPEDDPHAIHLVMKRYSPAEETRAVVSSVRQWIKDNPTSTVAILVPRNQRGIEVVSELQRSRVEYVELLRSTIQTRKSTGALIHVLRYLNEPQSTSKLVTLYQVWMRHFGNRRFYQDDRVLDETNAMQLQSVSKILRRITHVENFIWPGPGADWLEDAENMREGIGGWEHELDQHLLYQQLMFFRDTVRRWQAAVVLPVDQLLLTVAQDLFREAVDLALAYKLASLIRKASLDHPDWRLAELTRELETIAKNERKFLGFSQDDLGFTPSDYPGRVVVATVHKAKGLEWDKVYIVSANTYDFPHDPDEGKYIAEKWFVREKLNLPAETLKQLEVCFSSSEWDWYETGVATQIARLKYIRERLRLFYVAVTRAKRELVITWNSGRDNEQPCLALIALYNYWEGRFGPEANQEWF